MRFNLLVGNLGPVLDAYVRDRDRCSVITGPLGSGKTFGSCQRVLTHMIEQAPNYRRERKTRFYAIRNTYPDLMTTTIKDWRELFEDLGRFKGGGIEPPTHSLKFRMLDNTIVIAELVFLALDRPQAVKKLRGSQATGFWLNELKELEKSVVDMADLRHGRYPPPIEGGPSWHGMLGDTNSPDDDHWLYELEQITKPEGWNFYRQPGGVTREMVIEEPERQEEVELPSGQTTYITIPAKMAWTGKWLPNPEAENLRNLPKNYYVHGMEGKSADWIAVNLANEYGVVEDGKPVYKEQWHDSLHVSDTILRPEEGDIWIGMDFGLTPSAAIGYETARGAVLIPDEITSEGMGVRQFAETLLLPFLRRYYGNCTWNFVGDPAGNKRAETDEETVFSILEEVGIYAEEAPSNDPTVRQEAVRYFLTGLRDGKPAFRLHPRCKMIRKGFNGGYHFRRVQKPGSTKYFYAPEKNKYSHPHDAVQYLCLKIKGYDGPTDDDFRRGDEGRWSR